MYETGVHLDAAWQIPLKDKSTAPVGEQCNCAKTAELIEMPFRWLTYAGSWNKVLVGRAHWRNLVNTTELSATPTKTK